MPVFAKLLSLSIPPPTFLYNNLESARTETLEEMKKLVAQFCSSYSMVVLIGGPVILVSISVLLLAHSPRLWFASPPSMVGENGSSLSGIMSHDLHLAGEGAPAQAPTISTFSDYSYAAAEPTSDVILLGQEKNQIEHESNSSQSSNNTSETEKPKTTGEVSAINNTTKQDEMSNTPKINIREENQGNNGASQSGKYKIINTRSTFNATVKQREDNKRVRVESEVERARAAIREAAMPGNRTSPLADPDYVPLGPVYRHAYAFHRSYLEMEKIFKVYVYGEAKPPMFHDGPVWGIYSSEGLLIRAMETRNWFRTMDPNEAHVYFLPFSILKMLDILYKPKTYDTRKVEQTVRDYVGSIAGIYPYWNSSLGADHVMLSCHDWGPDISEKVPNLYNNSIRVLCNANSSEGFVPSKDAALPEINTKTRKTIGAKGGPPSPSRRSVLGFFAGRLHGPIREVLLNHWKNKDSDLHICESLPKHVNYETMMRSSRFCICPSGYEVASPRIVEAILAECVPVLISEYYVVPFSDALDWKSFSVSIRVKDIPELKNILASMSWRHYIRMRRRVKQVQRHFVVNNPPRRYDLFHMTLHSIWLRRLNVGHRPAENIIDIFQ